MLNAIKKFKNDHPYVVATGLHIAVVGVWLSVGYKLRDAVLTTSTEVLDRTFDENGVPTHMWIMDHKHELLWDATVHAGEKVGEQRQKHQI